VSIQGEGVAFYFWEVRGLPEKRRNHEVAEGMTIERRYLTTNGEAISLENAQQGDVIVAQIKVSAEKYWNNVVIDDLLPAGLEIENPRLDSRQNLPKIGSNTLPLDNLDIRDDRLLIYTNLRPNAELTYSYLLRAVTAGTFTLPPITAECMYDPNVRAASSSGFVTVKR